MEEGTRQVKEGVSATNQAGEALQQIICKAEEVGDMIAMIATASTEQSSATEEVKNNMEQISRLVEASTIGSQQSAKACQDLSTLTNSLRNLVEHFRLSGDEASGARLHSSQDNFGSPRLEAKRVDEANSIHGSNRVH
jgi:methyl-accepting chemotaxis protein